jgi:predicted N-acetyltransferase YhbS
MNAMFHIAPEAPADAHLIEALHAAAFGPGRFTRAAFRLREQGPHDAQMSFVVRENTIMRATIRMTPILIGETSAWLLGPLAVMPGFAGQGMGKALLRYVMERVDQPVLLVGDPPYYGPFGFEQVSAARVIMPGPVDPRRLLIAGLNDEQRSKIAGTVRHAQKATSNLDRGQPPAVRSAAA